MPSKPRRATESEPAKRPAAHVAPPAPRRLQKTHVLAGLLVGMALVAFGITEMRSNSLLTGGIAALAGIGLFFAMSAELNRFEFSRRDLPDLVHVWIPLAFVVLAVFFTFWLHQTLCCTASAPRTQASPCSRGLPAWRA